MLSVLFYSCTGSQYHVNNIKIDNVYSFTNKTKSDLYNKSLKWISLNMGWSNSVIDYKDSNVGTIIVKANVPAYDYKELVYISCIFEFNMKDEKVNIIITNNDDGNTFTKEYRNKFKNTLENICIDYNNYLNKNDDF